MYRLSWVWSFREISHHFRGICGIYYLNPFSQHKTDWKIDRSQREHCGQLNPYSRGSHTVTPPRRMKISLRMESCRGFSRANQGTLFMEVLWHPFGTISGMEKWIYEKYLLHLLTTPAPKSQQQEIAHKKSKRSKRVAAERWKTWAED